MIRVSFDPYMISVIGHAESAPKGEDLVCAAVSILVHALDSMLDIYSEGLIRVCAEGRYIIGFNENSKLDHEADIAIEMFARGLEMLCENYPEFIKKA